MPCYWDDDAIAYLLSLKRKDQSKLLAKVSVFSRDPQDTDKGTPLSDTDDMYKVRHGNHRAICRVVADGGVVRVTVVKAGHRSKIYDR